MSSKGANAGGQELINRDEKANIMRREKKKAHVTKAKKSTDNRFSLEDAKMTPIKEVEKEIGKDPSFPHAAKLKLVADKVFNEFKGEVSANPANREIIIIGLDFRGDTCLSEMLSLEQVQNSWPSLKGWAFAAGHGDSFDMGKHNPSKLGGKPAWMFAYRSR